MRDTFKMARANIHDYRRSLMQVHVKLRGCTVAAGQLPGMPNAYVQLENSLSSVDSGRLQSIVTLTQLCLNCR